MKAATGEATPGPRLKACSYVTVKDGEPQIFRHAFDSRPRLMSVGEGSVRVEAPPGETLAIGRAIDLETPTGRILLGAGCYFATDERGDRVYLVSRYPVAYQVEVGPEVRPGGITG